MKVFLERMKYDLGEEYESFQRALQAERRKGLRVNTLNSAKERFLKIFPFELEPIPDCSEGYYVKEKGLWRHPYHHAGAFYLQDPSAMLPVQVMDPQPYERVLDLCASPGGKTTQIAAKMKNTGVLFANEIVTNRIPSLLSSIERMGVKNSVITNEKPDWYQKHFQGWFDRVLVDAPCSGEGMFRKSDQAIKDWSPQQVQSCARRQKIILSSASATVRPGGTLVYSTCTFSEEENEEVVASFLKERPDFELLPIRLFMGRPSKILPELWRVYPHHGGEGQCIALLRRKGEPDGYSVQEKPFPVQKIEPFHAFWQEVFGVQTPSLSMKGTEGFILPDHLPKLPNGKILRCGVYAGKLQKNRWIPSHHLFRAYPKSKPEKTVSLTMEEPERVGNYLRGYELSTPHYTGYLSIHLDGFSLGFGKASNGKMKNHYPKGLREMNGNDIIKTGKAKEGDYFVRTFEMEYHQEKKGKNR